MWFIFVAFLISFFFIVLLIVRYCLTSGMVVVTDLVLLA